MGRDAWKGFARVGQGNTLLGAASRQSSSLNDKDERKSGEIGKTISFAYASGGSFPAYCDLLDRRTALPRPIFSRLHIPVVVSVVVAVVTGNAALRAYRDYDETLQRSLTMIGDMAKVVEAHVFRTVDGADVVLRQAANMVREAGGLDRVRDERHWRRLREYAAHAAGGLRLWLFDASGNAILSTVQFPSPTLTVSDRDYFRMACRDRATQVGQAVFSRYSDEVIFTISRPLHDPEGTFIGVVVLEMNTAFLTDFYDLLGFDLAPVISVFRSDGQLVARHPDLETVVGASTASGQPVDTERLTDIGTSAVMPFGDGRKRLAADRTQAFYGLRVVVGIDQDRALADWKRRTLTTVTESAVSSGVMLLAIGWGMRSLARERRTQVKLRAIRKLASAKLDQAKRDPLTGLPGRALLLELAEAMRLRCEAEEDAMAILFIDLDGFKQVNDRFGHDHGDAVLVAVASALRSTLRDSDLAGRLGGDEFAVCLTAPPDRIGAISADFAERIIAQVGTVGHGVGCSIGIAVNPSGCGDLTCAIRHADRAMYQAKRSGRNRFAIFSASDESGDCKNCLANIVDVGIAAPGTPANVPLPEQP